MHVRGWNEVTHNLPASVRRTGYALLLVFFGSYVWFNGLSVATIDFGLGLATVSPFIAALLYGGYWLERSDISADRYPRIGAWFAGGFVCFLALNAAMIAAWPAEGAYNNIAWALFAASVGGAGGLAVGIFEARAIERAIAAERNRVRREEVEQRNEQLEEFADIVSHDLRSPLSVAEGRLELLKRDHESEHLEAMASAHDRMEAIIDRTLTLARSGQRLGETEPVDLEAIANGCWENVETGEATVEVADSATIVADRDRLHHLFENLFRNAIEHGGADAAVRVGVTEGGFYVEDDGPGIPEADREDVFTVEYSTSDGGIGFGLRIVKQVVEAHEWEIDISESADGGARFEVTGVEFASDGEGVRSDGSIAMPTA